MGWWILPLCIGVAGYAGYSGWPLYVVPLIGAVYASSVVFVTPDGVAADAHHAQITIPVYAVTFWAMHSIGMAVYYGIGFGIGYLLPW